MPDLDDAFGSFDEHWQPRRLARVNDHDVKIAKVQGEFVWHAHDDSDELFLVHRGRLRIELRDGAVELGPGDVHVVPRGVEHRPVADEETWIVMVEAGTTVNTGSAGGDRTVEVQDLTDTIGQ